MRFASATKVLANVSPEYYSFSQGRPCFLAGDSHDGLARPEERSLLLSVREVLLVNIVSMLLNKAGQARDRRNLFYNHVLILSVLQAAWVGMHNPVPTGGAHDDFGDTGWT